jgi:transposase
MTAQIDRGAAGHNIAVNSLLNDIPAKQVIIAVGYTDLRMQIDGLAALIQQAFKLDPCAQNLYIFCGKRSDRIKALYFDGDGFILLYKRLERARFQWPRKESEARQITPQQLRWLLEGLSIEQPRAIRAVGSVLVV